MELTRTNRSGGLTTFFSRSIGVSRRLHPSPPQGRELATSHKLEARREKVKAITTIASHQRLVEIEKARMHDLQRSPER